MDCSGNRSNAIERDSDLGENLSHGGDHTDEELRDCDSMDGDLVISGNGLVRAGRFNSSQSAGGEMNFNSSGSVAGGNGGALCVSDHTNELQMSHHHHHPFAANHPLGALSSFMGIGSLHGLPNLQQHNDVLEKLKMQVRDMKVGLMQEQDYASAHAAATAAAAAANNFGANVLPTPINTAFSLPPTSAAGFAHAPNLGAAGTNSVANGSGCGIGAAANGGSVPSNANSSITATTAALTNGSFSFTSPTAPSTKDVNPASNSSSEASNSSLQNNNNGWSFEEQYKQVRQLYEINDDPKRKEFLDDLFSFMQKKGTPINRLPIMAKSVLDLYELYNLVIARGGLVDVINKKLWQEIIKGLHLPSSITSAAFTLRTQYMKYLYTYECEKKNLSSPAELQAAIDGNRREGRRSSYGQFESMHNQLQIPQSMRQSLPNAMQQMSPLALVTHAAAQNGPTAQSAVAAAVAHHRLMGPAYTQVPNLMAHEIEQRMREYLKIIQGSKEPLVTPLQQQQQHQQQHQQQQQQHKQQQQLQQQQRQRSQSPDITTREALNALEMSRVALWQMYHNNTSPPASVNTSPQGLGCAQAAGAAAAAEAAAGVGGEPQSSEALNLSETPSPKLCNIKREREPTPDAAAAAMTVCDDFQHLPPPAKRCAAAATSSVGNGGLIPNFYLPPHNITNVGGFVHHMRQDSDGEHEAEAEDDDEDDDDDVGDADDDDNKANFGADLSGRRHMNGHLQHHHQHHHLPLQQQQQQQQQQLFQQHQLLLRQQHEQQSNQHGSSHNNNGSNNKTSSCNNNNHHDKSDDSAIESSPTTSGSADKGHHRSPLTSKKAHLSKQLQHQHQKQKQRSSEGGNGNAVGGAASGNPLEQLNLLSGMQFRIARNGTGLNGEQQLVVNLELNGIKYSGVLIANTATAGSDCEEDIEMVSAADTEAEAAAVMAAAATTVAAPAAALVTSPRQKLESSINEMQTEQNTTTNVAISNITDDVTTDNNSPLKLTNGPSNSVAMDALVSL